MNTFMKTKAFSDLGMEVKENYHLKQAEIMRN